MSGEFFYFILQFLKIKTKEFSFRMVFNKFSTYKYIQYTNTYKYSFQHFNIVFNKFSTFQQHHNNFTTSYQQFYNKLSTIFQQVFNKFSTYQKLLFLKINFFCTTNNSTSHQLINKKNKKEKKIKKENRISSILFASLCFYIILYGFICHPTIENLLLSLFFTYLL